MTHRPRRGSHPATIIPPPAPDPSLSPIENTVSLTALSDIGPNIFTNTHPQWQPAGARGIFGGSVIAQALRAAELTVPREFAVHSMHCYFVLAGNSAQPILYHVEVVRAGRSFHTRSVQARQKGRCIFLATCSFQLPVDDDDEEEESGSGGKGVGVGGIGGRKRMVRHQVSMPTGVPAPEQCESETALVERLVREGRVDATDADMVLESFARDPFDWRRMGVSSPSSPSSPSTTEEPAEKVSRSWVRSKARLRDPAAQLAALAYFSDSQFIGTVGRHNPQARRSQVGMQVSLDHTIYFHRGARTRVDEGWLFCETKTPWAGDERGLVTQRVWDQQGRLVATCVQEGLVRLRDGREGADAEGAVASKL